MLPLIVTGLEISDLINEMKAMVSEHYPDPPVVEAVCEFIFSSDTPWDSTVPGLLYEKIKQDYPIKETRNRQSIDTSRGNKQQIEVVEGIAFISADRNSQILTVPRIVAIVYTKPYPSWDIFFKRIKEIYKYINDIQPITNIDRIGLMYVDKIIIPSQEPTLDLEEYFNFRPELGENSPFEMINFSLDCTLTFNDNRDICRVSLRDAMAKDKTESVFILSTDYSIAMPKTIEPSSAIEWIDSAHTSLIEVFESSITEKTRDIFRS